MAGHLGGHTPENLAAPDVSSILLTRKQCVNSLGLLTFGHNGLLLSD